MIDTFDLKPDALPNIRGTFSSPAGRTFPAFMSVHNSLNIAAVMDKFFPRAFIRSPQRRSRSGGPLHADLRVIIPTPCSTPGSNLTTSNRAGSVIANEQDHAGTSLPMSASPPCTTARVRLTPVRKLVPFVIEADPVAPVLRCRPAPPLAVDASRLEDRRGLLSKVDRFPTQRRNSAGE